MCCRVSLPPTTQVVQQQDGGASRLARQDRRHMIGLEAAQAHPENLPVLDPETAASFVLDVLGWHSTPAFTRSLTEERYVPPLPFPLPRADRSSPLRPPTKDAVHPTIISGRDQLWLWRTRLTQLLSYRLTYPICLGRGTCYFYC